MSHNDIEISQKNASQNFQVEFINRSLIKFFKRRGTHYNSTNCMMTKPCLTRLCFPKTREKEC